MLDRRSLLGRLIGFFVGSSTCESILARQVSEQKKANELTSRIVEAVDGGPPVDTTTMHNRKWRTCTPAGSLEPSWEVKVTEVDLLEIVHDGDCNDGFPTWVKIDGRMLGGPGGINAYPRWEKSILLVVNAGEALHAAVTYADYSVEVFVPKQFDLTLDDLRVQIHPDRCPCKIWVGGHEPRVKSLRIWFAEGEEVLVDLRFKPHTENN